MNTPYVVSSASYKRYIHAEHVIRVKFVVLPPPPPHSSTLDTAVLVEFREVIPIQPMTGPLIQYIVQCVNVTSVSQFLSVGLITLMIINSCYT